MRDGYERTKFKHWIDEGKDRCSTHNALLAEAVTQPTIGAGLPTVAPDAPTTTRPSTGPPVSTSTSTSTAWWFFEAWDASALSGPLPAARRPAYVNGLCATRFLVVVTVKNNRSKAGQDPAQWIPLAADAQCTHLSDSVSIKHRRSLTVDRVEPRLPAPARRRLREHRRGVERV
ncbi:hypothetical protein [Streptomyces sp. C10]|uniref:hypothetical protein n=1 Tax=Streptomyces sp. C10 TaxID=531941 RepID=UPI0039816255